jgi:hypothetical protein
MRKGGRKIPGCDDSSSLGAVLRIPFTWLDRGLRISPLKTPSFSGHQMQSNSDPPPASVRNTLTEALLNLFFSSDSYRDPDVGDYIPLGISFAAAVPEEGVDPMRNYQFIITSYKKPKKAKKATKGISSESIARKYVELQRLREHISEAESRRSSRRA